MEVPGLEGTGSSYKQWESVQEQVFIQPKAEPPRIHRLPQGITGN